MGRSKSSLYLIFGEEGKVVEIGADKNEVYCGQVPNGPIVNQLIETNEGSYGIAKDGTVFQIEKASKTTKIIRLL